MIYIFLDNFQIKLLGVKKGVIGQYDTCFFTKQYQIDLLAKKQQLNIDLLASAIKEALTTPKHQLKEKAVCLILPQSNFLFLKTSIPEDIARSALLSFIKDKFLAAFQIDLDNCLFDYLNEIKSNQQIIHLYAIEKELFNQYEQVFKLINYRLHSVLPETLTYFKLFQKTLRPDKNEKIFYVDYEKSYLAGFIFDNYGLILPDKWFVKLQPDQPIEPIIKQQIAAYNQQGHLLNRLILSGDQAEIIRQDTFTKAVGLWTNPLKKIISNFYQDYLKQLIFDKRDSFSVLRFASCFGAFVFSLENKRFLISKKSNLLSIKSIKKLSLPSLPFTAKDIGIVFVSFLFSFVVFYLLGKTGFKLPNFNPTTLVTKPSLTPTPTVTLTPTPSFSKADLKIKVLNGSGITGKAAEVKEILIKKGYLGEIITDNADSFDYETTVIKAKSSFQAAALMIEKDLQDNLKKPKQMEINDEETSADIILIVGKDFE